MCSADLARRTSAANEPEDKQGGGREQIVVRMPRLPTARELLDTLVGTTVRTVTG